MHLTLANPQTNVRVMGDGCPDRLYYQLTIILADLPGCAGQQESMHALYPDTPPASILAAQIYPAASPQSEILFLPLATVTQ
jgi:hypothetical protein